MPRRSDNMHRRSDSDDTMVDAYPITASSLASILHWSPQSIAPAEGQAVDEVDLLCYAFALMSIEDPERSGPQYELKVPMDIDQPEVEDTTTTDEGPVANLDEVKSQQVASEGSSSRAGRAASPFTAEVLAGPSSSSQEAGVQEDAVQPQGKAKNKKKKKSQSINKHMAACLEGFRQSYPDVFLTPATAHARAVAAGAGTASDRYRRAMRDPVQAPTSRRDPSPAPRRATHDKVASSLVADCFGPRF